VDEKGKSFLVRFLPAFFIPYLLIHFIPLEPLNSAVASTQNAFFDAAGFETELDGSLLVIRGATEARYRIITDCSGLVMVFLFAALLYASKPSWKALLIYSPLLLAFNLLRLFITLFAGVQHPPLFEATHAFFWFVDSGVVLLAWSHATGVRLW
jgi:exosortase/archaeosortase family protein